MKCFYILFLVISIHLLSQDAVPAGPVYKVGQFGQGEGDIYLNAPAGITSDENGYVYVCDTGNDRIVKYFSDGGYITCWYGDESGSYCFNRPMAIQMANVEIPNLRTRMWEAYVTDCYNYSVRVFDTDGNLQREWNIFRSDMPRPPKVPEMGICINPEEHAVLVDGNPPMRIDQGASGIAIDSTGNVYVGDTLNYRILKFDHYGNYQTEWSTDGWPGGICVDSSDNVYVVHNQYHYISKYGPKGDWIKSWGGQGGGNSQMYHPAGIYVEEDSLFLCDYGNNRVQKFNTDGYWKYSFGVLGSPLVQDMAQQREQYFRGPVGIVTVLPLDTRLGAIYVIDSQNGLVQYFQENRTK